MFSRHHHPSAVTDRLRPDRRHIPTESEIRMRVKRTARAV